MIFKETIKMICPNILFALPESVLDKSKARFRRLQNSPAAQTVAIADLALRQDLCAKTLSMAAQSDIWAKRRSSIGIILAVIIVFMPNYSFAHFASGTDMNKITVTSLVHFFIGFYIFLADRFKGYRIIFLLLYLSNTFTSWVLLFNYRGENVIFRDIIWIFNPILTVLFGSWLTWKKQKEIDNKKQ